MAHPVVHFELAAPNHDTLAKWYADLFDWSYNTFPDMSYATVGWDQEAGRNGGGYMPANEEVPFGTLTLYIYTEDVDAHMERIVAAGGTPVGVRQDVPGIGAWWRFRDPAGNYMAVMTPDMSAIA